MNRNFSNMTIPPEKVEIARQRDRELREQHHKLKTEFPDVSHGDEKVDGEMAYRKRLIYRSKQRGWLEVDLLMGSWASKHVPNLPIDELKHYEDILNEETIDIFNYITGKDPVPDHLDTPMMKRLQEYCASNPIGKSSPEEFAKNKKHMSN